MHRFATLILAAAIAVLAAAAPAGAGPITGIVVFGDSLSDVGNIYGATHEAIPISPPHYQGRFSNGPVWVEYLADHLGLDASTPAGFGGTNYAIGGAQTGWGVASGVIPNVGEMIGTYLDSATPSGGELFVIWAGGNDFLNGSTNTGAVASNMADHVRSLALAGGSRFLVPNLPLLGLTPRYRFSAESAAMNARTQEYNQLLCDELDALEASLGITIHRLDVASIIQEAVDDPGRYGFDNVTAGAYQSSTGWVAPNADAYMFWDDIHPAALGHQMLGEQAVAAVVPEPSAICLLAAGLGLLIRRMARAG